MIISQAQIPMTNTLAATKTEIECKEYLRDCSGKLRDCAGKLIEDEKTIKDIKINQDKECLKGKVVTGGCAFGTGVVATIIGCLLILLLL